MAMTTGRGLRDWGSIHSLGRSLTLNDYLQSGAKRLLVGSGTEHAGL